MIADYATLVGEIAEWLDRDDLSARIPTFIQVTEARLNRLLEDPEMEVVTTLTGDGATLPADFGSMVSIGTADGNPLQAIGNAEYAAILPQSGTSRYYTIRGGAIYYVPGAANVALVYRRRLPPLNEDNATNWLLELAPDIYLYGALMAASAFLVEDERVSGWKSAYDEAIMELRADGGRRKWGAGPLAPRLGRP